MLDGSKTWTRRGNQVKVLSDPVTVNRECPFKYPLYGTYEKDEGMRDDLQARKPAYYLRRDFRRKLVPDRCMRTACVCGVHFHVGIFYGILDVARTAVLGYYEKPS